MYYGQHLEDKYIQEYFDEGYIGTCVDIGSAQPINGNNTFFFEEKGWSTYCIEPNPSHIPNLKNHRKNVFNLACGDKNQDNVEFTICTLPGGNQEALSSLTIDERLLETHKIYSPILTKINVNVVTLNTFLIENKIEKLDFVSIDTEGTELDVLKGFNIEKYSPKLLVIENNHNDSHIEDYLKQFNYIKDKRIMVNDFYLKK
jgi:FkbM family methyltransferase